jgi:hypothetical protein
MAGIKKIGKENFEQERLQMGQSDRYGSFKEMVEAEAAGRNVGRMLKLAAATDELERKQEVLAILETKLKLYREYETTYVEFEAEYGNYE